MTRVNKNIFFTLPAILLATLFFAASCSNEEPVRIGFVGGLSGRVADLGISGRNGAILAVEEANTNGGVNGRAVELIVMDDKQDPEVAEQAVTDLIGMNVDVIIGHMTSSMSTRTVPIINKRKVVMISPTSTTTNLSGKDDYFIRVCATTDRYATKMARYVYNQVGMRAVSAMYDENNKSYTETWLSHFSREFTRLGGSIVHQEAFHSGPETHFLDIAQNALKAEADGLIISASALDAAMICQQVRKLGSTLPIAVSEWAATEKLIELGGIAVEGIIVSQFFNRYSRTPPYMQFREKYNRRFGSDPSFSSVAAYDSTRLALSAFQEGVTRKMLKEHIIKQPTYSGIQGDLTIDRFGDSDRRTFISIVDDGRFMMAEEQR